MNLIIDVGNTRVKLAVFENDTLIDLLVFNERELLKKIDFFLLKYPIEHGIISTVKVFSKEMLKSINERTSFLMLNPQTKVPFVNRYSTKGTLGMDRIALVSNASIKYLNKNVLIIDAGTCITYDFINSKNEYLGGAISPGISMRYKSLHNYTAKLPLLEKKEIKSFLGDSTENSIHSGIVKGIIGEITSFIKGYDKENEDLTVVLTGGDTYFLAKQLKSSIFANPNFVLEGLNTILIYNNKEC